MKTSLFFPRGIARFWRAQDATNIPPDSCILIQAPSFVLLANDARITKHERRLDPNLVFQWNVHWQCKRRSFPGASPLRFGGRLRISMSRIRGVWHTGGFVAERLTTVNKKEWGSRDFHIRTRQIGWLHVGTPRWMTAHGGFSSRLRDRDSAQEYMHALNIYACGNCYKGSINVRDARGLQACGAANADIAARCGGDKPSQIVPTSTNVRRPPFWTGAIQHDFGLRTGASPSRGIQARVRFEEYTRESDTHRHFPPLAHPRPSTHSRAPPPVARAATGRRCRATPQEVDTAVRGCYSPLFPYQFLDGRQFESHPTLIIIYAALTFLTHPRAIYRNIPRRPYIPHRPFVIRAVPTPCLFLSIASLHSPV
ncbi:hypothetical protein C8J57DRAFT_1485518 [Mycena rebaudengoi]|nr:hypothetical protein C8J57DRAFT_1485518 [Mycena rebaudengoi]